MSGLLRILRLRWSRPVEAAVNLGLVALAAVLAVLWSYVYTSGPVLLGTLGAVTILATLGLLVKSLPDAVLPQFRNWLWRVVFTNAKTKAWLSAIMLMQLLLYFEFIGYLHVVSLDSDATLWILDADGIVDGENYSEALARTTPHRIGKQAPFRDVSWFIWPWSRHEVVVKVSGFPDRRVEVRPGVCKTLYFPRDFDDRPVVLIQPAPLLMAIGEKAVPKELHIEIIEGTCGQQKKKAVIPFDGHAVWVGCDADVTLPARVVSQFKDELQGNWGGYSLTDRSVAYLADRIEASNSAGVR